MQVCVLDRDGRMLANRRCENSRLPIATLVRRHGRRVRAGIESCTGAADLAEQLMQWAGWSLDLAHPGYVHRIKQNPDKSDFSDARLLADLVRVDYLRRDASPHGQATFALLWVDAAECVERVASG